MTWTLSVSAPKREFADAASAAESSPTDLGDVEQSQADLVKETASRLVATFDEDSGMVGLSANGTAGASGLIAFSLSVASAPDPQPPAEAASDELTEARDAARSRYAPGERPEAPGTVDHGAVAAAAQAEAEDPRRAAYQPDREPEQPADAPTSLADDAKAAAATRKTARK